MLIDEADALAQSRNLTQMHHEDRAGVNAFIRGVDLLSSNKLPAAVIMCTNRPEAIDPAISRRAADVLTFTRPNAANRYRVIAPLLQELGFSNGHIESIVKATGSRKDGQMEFTYSDLKQRLLPAIVLDAYPDRAVEPEVALNIAKRMVSTTPFRWVR